MKSGMQILTTALATMLAVSSGGSAENPGAGPQYTDKGQLKRPEHYREWVYLSTGFDMSYRATQQPGHHMFDNVFVEPAAYRVFLQTGTWPDKMQLALEVRGAGHRASITKDGSYQDTEVMGLEVHVKDASRFPGQWAFFVFDGEQPGTLLPQAAECYACHAAHAAVDTTFVQFYPTLLPIAESKGTLSSAYQKDVAAWAHK